MVKALTGLLETKDSTTNSSGPFTDLSSVHADSLGHVGRDSYLIK